MSKNHADFNRTNGYHAKTDGCRNRKPMPTEEQANQATHAQEAQSGRHLCPQHQKVEDEMVKISDELDDACMDVGLIVSALFQTASMAALQLPNMDLYTDVMGLEVEDGELTLHINLLGRKTHEECDDDDEDESDQDEEEDLHEYDD